MLKAEISDRLLAFANPGVRDTALKLIPGAGRVLGVPVPALRNLAREIARDDWRAWLGEQSDDSYEEILLQGLVIAAALMDLDERLRHIRLYVAKIDNWALCDSFCLSLKCLRKHRREVWDFIQPYLVSEREFDVRFGLIMLLGYYVDEEHLERLFSIFDSTSHPGYYVKMGVAWTLSLCFVRFPERTLRYLRECGLDKDTLRKSYQKIVESRRVSEDRKNVIRAMRAGLRTGL